MAYKFFEVFEGVWCWFVMRPDRIINVGSTFSFFGRLLLSVGLFGKVATTAANILNQVGKQSMEASLTTMYPGLPTWWIPESTEGLVFSALLMVSGFLLTHYGKQMKSLLRNF